MMQNLTSDLGANISDFLQQNSRILRDDQTQVLNQIQSRQEASAEWKRFFARPRRPINSDVFLWRLLERHQLAEASAFVEQGHIIRFQSKLECLDAMKVVEDYFREILVLASDPGETEQTQSEAFQKKREGLSALRWARARLYDDIKDLERTHLAATTHSQKKGKQFTYMSFAVMLVRDFESLFDLKAYELVVEITKALHPKCSLTKGGLAAACRGDQEKHQAALARIV